MRIINLIERKNGNGRPDVPLHDQDLLLQVAYSANDPTKGATYEEMDKSCKLADKVKINREALKLEDADWAFLAQKFKVMPWNTNYIDPEVVRDLGKAILEAPEAKETK